MKPSVQKIVTKLAKEQEKKVEKVELTTVQKIEQNYKKLDAMLSEIEQKLDEHLKAEARAGALSQEFLRLARPSVVEGESILRSMETIGIQDKSFEQKVRQLKQWRDNVTKTLDRINR